MLKLDLKYAYLTVQIHIDHQFLHIHMERLTNSTYLPFMLAFAPRVLIKLLRSLVTRLRSQGIKTKSHRDDLISLESLGFVINFEKSVQIPSQNL